MICYQLIGMLNVSINFSDMITIFINKLLFICNTPLPNIKKYRYPIHIKKILNKCRHLHKIMLMKIVI